MLRIRKLGKIMVVKIPNFKNNRHVINTFCLYMDMKIYTKCSPQDSMDMHITCSPLKKPFYSREPSNKFQKCNTE